MTIRYRGARKPSAPVGKVVEGKVRKVGPEAKLKSYTIGKLKSFGLLWWRNQSGAIRVAGKGGRSYMVRMGTPGLPDLMLIGIDGRLWCIELKAAKGKVRPEQIEFFRRVKEYSGDHARCFFARSTDDIDSILTAATRGGFIDEGDYQK